MEHSTTRATILPEVVKLIMDKFKMNEEKALDAFYSSATGASFADDDTGLYGQSPYFIFGLYEKEMDEKKMVCQDKCRDNPMNKCHIHS